MHTRLPSIYNFPFNGPRYMPGISIYQVVPKEYLKNTVLTRVSELHLQWIDYCYDACRLDSKGIYSSACRVLGILSYDREWLPGLELHPLCPERSDKVLAEYGIPNDAIISLIGTMYGACRMYANKYVVLNGQCLDKAHSIKIINQQLLPNDIFPSMPMPGIPNCEFQLIEVDMLARLGNIEPLSERTFKALSWVHRKIRSRISHITLDIVEEILKQYGYIQ